ncbi:MAG: hypothetical protein J1E06_04785, partial [Acutalibacter sp.]|nr:hypothetical protein [Acutalibacter sp.]
GKVVVCFDIANYNGSVSTKSAVNSFLGWVDDCHQYLDLSISSEDIELEIIPGMEAEPVERSAALQRIRAEIMAGRGPDVFICVSNGTFTPFGAELHFRDEDIGLFPYVEKLRESGMFLPLDGMLSNLTLSHVDDLLPQVMSGGKNQAGEQVILPLTFVVPGTIIVGDDLPECDFEGTSWADVLQGDDPVLREQGNWFLQFYDIADETYTHMGNHDSGLFCLYPRIVDFETDSLAFTEGELASLIKDSLAGYRQFVESGTAQPCFGSIYLSPWDFFWREHYSPEQPNEVTDLDFTFFPLRNLEGGSTAVVNAYCAVNAATEREEQALAVIDALLYRDHQKGGMLYQHFAGMPINKELVSPEIKYINLPPLTPKQYETWLRICEDINIVRFPSPLDRELNAMMRDIEDPTLVSRYPDGFIRLSGGRFANFDVTGEEVDSIVSEHYRNMQRLLDES